MLKTSQFCVLIAKKTHYHRIKHFARDQDTGRRIQDADGQYTHMNWGLCLRDFKTESLLVNKPRASACHNVSYN